MSDLPRFPPMPAKWALAGAFAALLVGATIGRAVAAEPRTPGSATTSTATRHCRKVAVLNIADAESASSRVCPGFGGLIVLLQEDDLRETVSVGRSRAGAEKEPAASQGFGPFNSTAETIEWRLDAKARPFAIIQRWHIADNSDEDKDGRPIAKPMLVVTRLPPGPACHVAYIDVQANPDANELARKAADEMARGFKCGEDAVRTIGESGRAVELALRR